MTVYQSPDMSNVNLYREQAHSYRGFVVCGRDIADKKTGAPEDSRFFADAGEITSPGK